MALSIPPEPTVLSPEVAPPGYRIKLLPFNDQRRFITPRIQLAHTNGASTAGSIESSFNWSMRNTWDGYVHGNPRGPKYTTIAHFQVDLDGDAAMLLELNRQGIVNAKANPFSLGYETADQGYNKDPYPTGSYFTEPQLQKMANGFAYCHMLFKIALEYPKAWDGNGSACHTEPFGYPYWTTSVGKPCPGNRKKQQVRDVVLPHARKIVAAWTGATPTPPPDPTPTPPPTPSLDSIGVLDMIPCLRQANGTVVITTDFRGGLRVSGQLFQSILSAGAVDAKTGRRLTAADPSTVPDSEIVARFGGPITG